jgi:hypothetical protein
VKNTPEEGFYRAKWAVIRASVHPAHIWLLLARTQRSFVVRVHHGSPYPPNLEENLSISPVGLGLVFHARLVNLSRNQINQIWHYVLRLILDNMPH